MTKETQDQRKDYLSHLSRILDQIGEDGLRKLCNKMGKDYQTIDGKDVSSKAILWIKELEDLDMIPSLINCGKDLFPDLSWDDPTQEEISFRLKYFIASGLNPYAINSEF